MTTSHTTPRKALSRMQRLKLFEAHGGVCVICGQAIRGGEKWIDEHVRALGLMGTNDMDNRGPAHVRCAEVKTREQDVPAIAKAKRVKAKHLGIKSAKSRPIMGSKASGWKHKVNGDWEKRQ